MALSLIGALTVVSFFSAAISGFVGTAGGALLLGAMLSFGIDLKVAVPVHALVQLVSTNSRTVALLPNARWRSFLVLAIYAAPGPLIGFRLFSLVDAAWLKVIIAVLILWLAWVPRFGLGRVPEPVAFAIAGALGGSLGVVLGAVGVLLGPFFLRPNWNKLEVIATQALCLAYLQVLKIVGFVSIGFDFGGRLTLITPLLITTIVGTWIGTRLLRKAGEKLFVIVYKLVLSALAGAMLVPVLLDG
jgi:uncharacterized membrane protein YfcA